MGILDAPPKPVTVAATRSTTADAFPGSALADAWRVLRPQAGGVRVANNRVEIDTLPGDQTGTTDTAKNMIFRPMPEGRWEAQVKITGTPTADGQNFGMVAYVGPNRAAYLRRQGRPSGKTRVGFLWNLSGGQANDYTEVDSSSLTETWWARLVSDGKMIRAYTSSDGLTFTLVGQPVTCDRIQMGHIGLFAFDSSTGGGTPRSVAFRDFVITADPGPQVVPARLGIPTDTAPTDALAVKFRDALRLADKYAMGTLYPQFANPQAASPYLSFDTGSGGKTEAEIRPWAMTAYGLATSLATGAYSSTVAGSGTNARNAIVRLTASLAYRHAANTPGGWGPLDGTGQSTMWASWVAQAIWMQYWSDLTATERRYVYRMLMHEVHYQANTAPEIWKTPAGVELRPGDSGSDSNAWNTMPYFTAMAMVPEHPNRQLWRDRLVEMQINAYSRKEDCTSIRVVEGRQLSEWCSAGFNINSDGTVVNHGFIHPDYSCTMSQIWQAAVILPMAGFQPPTSTFFNADVVYSGLVDVLFPSPPYTAPGGFMYTRGSDAVYYPAGNDWGYARRMDKAAMDLMVDTFGIAPGVTVPAATWANLHIDGQATLSARSTSGQTYLPGDDDNYPLREQWVHMLAAMAWSARWIVSTKRFIPPIGRPAKPTHPWALPMRPGWYHTAPRSNTNNTFGMGATRRGQRVTFGRDCVLDRVAINVVTAGSAGSVVRLGLWREARDGSSWDLVLDCGTVDTTVTGIREATINQPVLGGETYVLTAEGQGAPTTAPVLHGTTSAPDPRIGDGSAATVITNSGCGVQGNSSTGALPTTTTFGLSVAVPVIAVRATS